MARRLGTITPGQAPRSDITPLLQAALPEGVELVQRGILDGLSRAEIAERFAVREGQPVIISRLLDGSSVVMDKERVEAAFQALVDQLEAEGCGTILLLCTGKFEHLISKSARLIEPQKIVMPALTALSAGLRVGILVPLPEQIAAEESKWASFSASPVCEAVSPYLESTEALEAAARRLADRGAELLLTDCMGFVEHHRAAARKASGLPVVLSTALISKLVAEVV